MPHDRADHRVSSFKDAQLHLYELGLCIVLAGQSCLIAPKAAMS